MIKKIDFDNKFRVLEYLANDPITRVYGLSYISGFPEDDRYYGLFELDSGYAVQMGSTIHIYGQCDNYELSQFCSISGTKTIYSYLMPLQPSKEITVLFQSNQISLDYNNEKVDSKSVHSLLKKCFDNIPLYNDYLNTVTEQRCYLGGAVFGIIEDDLIATASVLMQNNLSALVGAVATDPNYRRMGYGKRIVSIACSSIKNKPVVVFSSDDNAISMYKSMGFVEKKRIYLLEL